MRLAILTAALFALAAPAQAESETCAMSAADRAWTDTALATWRDYRTAKLHFTSGDAPTIVLFDAHCRYIGQAGAAVERFFAQAKVGLLSVSPADFRAAVEAALQ